MPVSPEQLYSQLGHLLAEAPDLATAQMTPEVHQWLARATVLVEQSGDMLDAVGIKTSAEYIGAMNRVMNANKIMTILYRPLARIEAKLPAAARGGFIPAGSAFGALAALGKVLGVAKRGVLLVDPYADEKLLTDFAVLVPEGVAVRVLAGTGVAKPALKPATERWVKQYGAKRPCEVRLAAAKTLHDRLIIIDGRTVYVVGQSFNKIAERAHTSITRVDDAVAAALKVEAYGEIWDTASTQ
jgi:hypothetical protein